MTPPRPEVVGTELLVGFLERAANASLSPNESVAIPRKTTTRTPMRPTAPSGTGTGTGTVTGDGDECSAGLIAGAVAGVLVLGAAVVLAVVMQRRSRSNRAASSKRVFAAELYDSLLQRVQAEFLLGYRQLIG